MDEMEPKQPTNSNLEGRVVVVSTRMVDFITPFRALLLAFAPIVAVLGLAVFQAVSAFEGIGYFIIIAATLLLASSTWLSTFTLRLNYANRSNAAKEPPNEVDQIYLAAKIVVSITFSALMVSVCGRILHAILHTVIRDWINSPIGKQIWEWGGFVLFSLIFIAFSGRKLLRDIESTSERNFQIRSILLGLLSVVLIIVSITALTSMQSANQLLTTVFSIPDSSSGKTTIEILLEVFACIGLLAFVAGNSDEIASQFRKLKAPKSTNSRRFTQYFVAVTLIFVSILVMVAWNDRLGKFIAGHFTDPNVSFGQFWSKSGLIGQLVVLLAILVAIILAWLAHWTASKRASEQLQEFVENGLFPAFFKRQHPRYGSYYRLILLIVVVQAVLIVAVQPINRLMGVVSFSILMMFLFQCIHLWTSARKILHSNQQATATTTDRIDRFPIMVPVLTMSFVGLLALAFAIIHAREVAVSFGLIGLFYLTAYYNRRHLPLGEPERPSDQLQFELSLLDHALIEQTREAEMRPILIAARHPQGLFHLRKILEENVNNRRDIFVMTVRISPDRPDNSTQTTFGRHERTLFQEVMRIAEQFGRHITPIVVAGTNSIEAIVRTAVQLNAEAIVLGLSGKVAQDEQIREFARIWRSNSEHSSQTAILRITTPKQDYTRLLDAEDGAEKV